MLFRSKNVLDAVKCCGSDPSFRERKGQMENGNENGLGGIFYCQDNVLGVVRIPNSLRRPLMSEEKVQIEILSGLHAFLPIDCRYPACDKRSASELRFVTFNAFLPKSILPITMRSDTLEPYPFAC